MSKAVSYQRVGLSFHCTGVIPGVHFTVKADCDHVPGWSRTILATSISAEVQDNRGPDTRTAFEPVKQSLRSG
jgi:hypothetical protein